MIYQIPFPKLLKGDLHFVGSVTISTPPPTTSTSSVSSTPDLVSSSPQASPSSSRVAIPAPPSSLVSSAPAVSSSHVSTPTQATSSSLPVFSSTPTHPPVSSTSPTTSKWLLIIIQFQWYHPTVSAQIRHVCNFRLNFCVYIKLQTIPCEL